MSLFVTVRHENRCTTSQHSSLFEARHATNTSASEVQVGYSFFLSGVNLELCTHILGTYFVCFTAQKANKVFLIQLKIFLCFIIN